MRKGMEALDPTKHEWEEQSLDYCCLSQLPFFTSLAKSRRLSKQHVGRDEPQSDLQVAPSITSIILPIWVVVKIRIPFWLP